MENGIFWREITVLIELALPKNIRLKRNSEGRRVHPSNEDNATKHLMADFDATKPPARYYEKKGLLELLSSLSLSQ